MQQNVDFLNIQQIYLWVYILIKKIIGFLNPVNISSNYYKYWPILMLFSLLISILFILGLIYVRRKMQEVSEIDSKIFDTVITSKFDLDGVEMKNERWEKILEYVNSDSPAEWRLAVLDADVILDEMLIKSGYHGDTIGEKLKSIERSDFETIDSAWEAHKIRNEIAHRGSDTILTQRTAKKAIESFRQVFKEFEYI
ncbi:MAG: hypothetical protein KAR54_01970 [Candidatus Pacebacteria bacterium]|nr:hypothetical protein [Candidatus Paceibacterota bacterium]